MDPNTIILVGTSILAVGVYIVWSRSGSGGSAQADMLLSAGLLHKSRQEYVEAEMKLEKALSEFEADRQADMGKMVSCLVNLASVYEHTNKPEQARQAFKRVLAHWQKQLAGNQLTVIDIDYAVSNMDFGRGTYDVAEFYIDNIVTLRERTLPERHPDRNNSYKIGAILLRKAGYTAEATELEDRGKY